MSTEGTPTPQATPTPTMTIQPGSSPAPASLPTVTIALEDYHRYRTAVQQFEEFKTKQAADMALKEKERLDALADSGRHKDALEETRKSYEKRLNESDGRYAQLEQQIYGEKTQTVIAQSLAGRQLNAKTPEGHQAIAAQLYAGLAPQFETSRSADGSYQTRHKVTGRPAAEVLKETLESEAYAHFFAATNRGGSGSDATRSPGNPQQPNSLDAIERDYFARQGQWASIGLGGSAGSH